MIKTIKVMICPNNKQRTKLFECAGIARFIYNLVHGIGIDIGIKSLAVCSNKKEYENINKTATVKKLKKKKRRLQRKISRKYCKNKKGVCYCKTCNIIKSEKQFLKIAHRLTNIRNNHIHQVTSKIVNRQPKFIVRNET